MRLTRNQRALERRESCAHRELTLKRVALNIAGIVLILMTGGGILAAILDPSLGKEILAMFVPVISTVLGGLVVWTLRGKPDRR